MADDNEEPQDGDEAIFEFVDEDGAGAEEVSDDESDEEEVQYEYCITLEADGEEENPEIRALCLSIQFQAASEFLPETKAGLRVTVGKGERHFKSYVESSPDEFKKLVDEGFLSSSIGEAFRDAMEELNSPDHVPGVLRETDFVADEIIREIPTDDGQKLVLTLWAPS